MQCSVYKSLRQYDYFLFVPTADEFSRVPGALRQLLGKLEKVIGLELHAHRSLAQADVREVLHQLEVQGYFLQMPAEPGNLPLDS